MAENGPIERDLDTRFLSMLSDFLGPKIRGDWGQEPLCSAASLRIAAGVSIGLDRDVVGRAAKTEKEARLLRELQRRQSYQGFGQIQVKRYAPGKNPETFYKS